MSAQTTHRRARRQPSPRDARLWKDNLRDYGLLGSLLLIVAFFYFITGGMLFRGSTSPT